MIIMGIETSCDETGIGIIEFDPEIGISSARILADEVASSVDEHMRFGGVVPEIASRAHLEALAPTVQRALTAAGISAPDAIAVTIGPGLVGALMVGVAAAKAYAMAWGVPLYGVNHLIAHIAVDTLEHGELPPAIALLVSGGHTNLLYVENLTVPIVDLGGTIDDAAGEAFDKVARLLGLGYPGGPVIDALALEGNPQAIDFPRGLKQDSYHFSFSGLKTAVARYVELAERSGESINMADVAASFQEAIADSISSKVITAAQNYAVSTIVLGGGATANSRIRHLVCERAADKEIEIRIPKIAHCTDNGIMIAALGIHMITARATPTDLHISCQPQLTPSQSLL